MLGNIGSGMRGEYEMVRYAQKCEKHRVPITIESPTVYYCPICKKSERLLIIREVTRPRWDKYDTWRSRYCQEHRNDKLWYSFRWGKINPLVLIYASFLRLKQKIKENKNGTDSTTHL